MNQSKVFSFVALAVMVFTLVFGGNIPAAAQIPLPPPPPPPGGETLKNQPAKIVQADRQAAAQRAENTGLTTPDVGEADMQMPGSAPRYFSVPNYANSPLPGNIVTQWNAIAQEFLQPTPMPGMPMTMGGVSMATAFVYMSYVQAAVYNALVGVEGGFDAYDAVPEIKTYLPFLMGGDSVVVDVNPASTAAKKLALAADPSASREAAVATAAFKVLIHYFPTDTTLAPKYADSLAAIPDGPAKTAGIAIGEAAAAAIIAIRTGDGLLAASSYTVPAPGPGVWEPTMLPDSTIVPPVDPWMADLKPFLRATPEQYRPVPPPALDDPAYVADLNEVKNIGAAMSMSRTPAQTQVAQFWTTNMVIQSNDSYRQLSTNRALNLIETARLMALGNMLATDSLIATFDSKYTYNFWRPITAIRHTNPDGSYSATELNTWMPAVMTPSFPEYVAGHGSFVSAQAELYTRFFGTPQIEIDLASSVTGTTRHFSTAAELRTEIINARTWGGLHYRTSSELAVALGQKLAAEGLAKFLGTDPASDTGQHPSITGGIRKFVDSLPGLDAAGANNLGQYIPVGVPDITTYPGSDYYEIAVVQYQDQMHSDLPPTLLRGYVQLSTTVVPGLQVPLSNVLLDGTVVPLTGYSGVTPPHYLGPTIVATKDRPVRILFRNLLPTGVDGNLFIPVDVTVMGSGMGPLADPTALEPDPLNPMCGMEPKPMECFTENRATLHLHGGISPWISDGTPHQWITPADEVTPYPQGVSVSPVPDMGDSGAPDDGAMTFYYTNQQSARLMFYHDHAWGITRLNVYAGEAAGYIITDDTEKSLITQGLIPDASSTIPLIIQDKTFVPTQAQLAVSDPLWDNSRWGSYGDLWLPHVYVPAQNPGDASGVNQFGRWAYGPWFWPPTSDVPYQPVANPYYDPACDQDVQWCEPPMMPGTPFVSMGMEAFNDTPVINGTVYPTLTVDPKTYRFRVLNAASDRFFNLSFYKAVDANGNACDLAANPTPAAESTGITCTEVALNPAEVAAALEDPTIHPTPLVGTEGPNWLQIGTEGGFLPAPTKFPAHPITWVTDPTVFNAGNVDLHSLLIAPAERADVIVDFSAFAGQTLILYNDAPAAFPARDPRYDYYTGNGDYRDTGGAPSTLPGYGPNVRTMMQIKVAAAAPAPAFNEAALETAFTAVSLGGQGVFENGQHPIIVGQGAYNSAYGTNFRSSGVLDGLARITDFSLTFRTLDNWELNQTITVPFQTKAIQDEMGEAYDPDYGRMSGNLGLEVPLTQAGVQQTLILYPFTNPASEIIDATNLPRTTLVTPISVASDGTQIWKITHNGVDTHPIHFHLFDVQMLNRVGWDGIIRPPEPNERGWKDTIRVSPLEDTIVAIRPIIPVVPFDLPNSIRPLNPMMPLGATVGFNSTDWLAQPTAPIVNELVNFGNEYVWHCHILSHEEMDMMRPISVAVPPRDPTALTGIVQGSGANQEVVLTWGDNSANETGFIVQRALTGSGVWVDLATLPVDQTTYTDVIGNTTDVYDYQVVAVNSVGYSGVPGYFTVDAKSISNIFTVDSIPPADPTALTATLEVGPQVLLVWSDNATDEIGFAIERADNGGVFTLLTTVAANTVNFTDTTVVPGSNYEYRVAAVKDLVTSAYTNTAVVNVPLPPADPTALSATPEAGPQMLLGWTDNAVNETGFVIERADNGGAFAPLAAVLANAGTGAVAYTDTTVVSGSSYAYRVAAVNESGSSAWVDAVPSPILVP